MDVTGLPHWLEWLDWLGFLENIVLFIVLDGMAGKSTFLSQFKYKVVNVCVLLIPGKTIGPIKSDFCTIDDLGFVHQSIYLGG